MVRWQYVTPILRFYPSFYKYWAAFSWRRRGQRARPYAWFEKHPEEIEWWTPQFLTQSIHDQRWNRRAGWKSTRQCRISIERLAKRGVIQLPAMQKLRTNNHLAKTNSQTHIFSKRTRQTRQHHCRRTTLPGIHCRLVDRWRELEEQVRKPMSETKWLPRWLLKQFVSKNASTRGRKS